MTKLSLYETLKRLYNSLNTKISGKADKVSSATNGHFAALNSNGNLTDSGKAASDFAASNHNHSGVYQPAGSYAAASHTHSEIKAVEGQLIAKVSTDNTIQDDPKIIFSLNLPLGAQSDILSASSTLTLDNMANLNRALLNPDSVPTVSSNNLITSGVVFEALSSKERNILKINLTHSTANGWSLVDALLYLSDMDFNTPMFSIIKVQLSDMTYYTFGSICKNVDELYHTDLDIVITFDGHILSWNDLISSQLDAETYHFNNIMSLTIENLNLFPTT